MSFMQGTQPEPSSDGEHIEPAEQDFLEDDDVHTPVAFMLRSDVQDNEEAELVEELSNRNAKRALWNPVKKEPHIVLEVPKARKGMKRPFPETYYARGQWDADEGSVVPEEQPDLEAYFGQWHIAPREVVLICRSYASYVASAQKATKK